MPPILSALSPSQTGTGHVFDTLTLEIDQLLTKVLIGDNVLPLHVSVLLSLVS